MDSYSETYEHSPFLTLIFIAAILQLLAGPIIYGIIRCCCPTSLKRTRPGRVLSDDNRIRTLVQPVIIQAPMEHVQMIQPPPPQLPTSPPMPPPEYSGLDKTAAELESRQPLMNSY